MKMRFKKFNSCPSLRGHRHTLFLGCTNAPYVQLTRYKTFRTERPTHPTPPPTPPPPPPKELIFGRQSFLFVKDCKGQAFFPGYLYSADSLFLSFLRAPLARSLFSGSPRKNENDDANPGCRTIIGLCLPMRVRFVFPFSQKAHASRSKFRPALSGAYDTHLSSTITGRSCLSVNFDHLFHHVPFDTPFGKAEMGGLHTTLRFQIPLPFFSMSFFSRACPYSRFYSIFHGGRVDLHARG